jgi:hypothetical protein
MRQHLATLFASSMLAGCSFLYDTSDLPNIDAPPPDMPIDAPPPDMPIDADPSMLFVSGVTPSVIVEGQGARDGEGQPLGSRPAVLLLEGSNFVKTGTTVTVQAAADETMHPTIVVDNDAIVVDITHTHLAVPVRIDVDPTIGTTSEQIDLDIVVKQTVGGTFERPLVGALKLQALPELTAVPAGGFTGSDTAPVFSSISLTTGTFSVAAGQTLPVRIRSMSFANIAIPIDVSASNATPGPAGGSGGTPGGSGGAGGPGGGPTGFAGTGGATGSPGMPGGDGGFGGVAHVPTLAGAANLNRSSGGGGGGGGMVIGGTLGASGGAGGGGGGSIQLRADGDLHVGSTISATGAAGAAGSNGLSNGGDGGDGTGGVVVLQAGGKLTVDGAVSVAGGADAPAGTVRFDAVDTSFTTGYRGPAFVDVPLIATTSRPTISVIGKANSDFSYYIAGASGGTDLVPGHFGSDGNPSIVYQFTLAEDLEPGVNRICVLVPDAAKGSDTETCASVAYLVAP